MLERIKTIEIDNRKFQLLKMDARTSLKVVRLLTAKVLPMIDTILPMLIDVLNNGIEQGDINTDTFISAISFGKIALALDLIDDSDLDKLINFGLSHCCEVLQAGAVQVLNQNGTYGVQNVEDDLMLTLRLSIESIAWSIMDFFDGNRWTSMFAGIAMPKLNTPILRSFMAEGSSSSQ